MSEDLDDIVDNLREPSAWIRVLYMVGFAVVLYIIIAPSVSVIMVVQALFAVLTGESNANLRRAGSAIGRYVLQIVEFLTYNSHVKPWPFTDFPPLDEIAEEPAGTDADSATAFENDDDKDKASSKSAGKKKSSAAKKSGAATKKAAKKSTSKKTTSRASTGKKTAASTAESDTDKPADQSAGDASAADDTANPTPATAAGTDPAGSADDQKESGSDSSKSGL